MVCIKDKFTIGNCSIWNGAMFGDLDWPLKASGGYVSWCWHTRMTPSVVSQASCWYMVYIYLFVVMITQKVVHLKIYILRR